MPQHSSRPMPTQMEPEIAVKAKFSPPLVPKTKGNQTNHRRIQ